MSRDYPFTLLCTLRLECGSASTADSQKTTKTSFHTKSTRDSQTVPQASWTLNRGTVEFGLICKGIKPAPKPPAPASPPAATVSLPVAEEGDTSARVLKAEIEGLKLALAQSQDLAVRHQHMCGPELM